MREILFRGKRTYDGTWVYGAFSEYDITQNAYGEIIVCRNPCVIDYDSDELAWNEVDPETVGQYTGLTDKNGKKIFEGDVVKDDWGKIYKVFYVLHSCAFMVNCSNPPNEYEKGNYRIGEAWCGTIKVIGNIHDNPELLEE